VIARADDDESGWRITEGGGCNSQPLTGERRRRATVAGDGPRKGAAASKTKASTLARWREMMELGSGRWNGFEDDDAGRGVTTNHQRKSGKDKQRLAMRARGKWMAMGSKRGRQRSTKASTLAMMKVGSGLQIVKRAWTQGPTIDGRVMKASSG